MKTTSILMIGLLVAAFSSDAAAQVVGAVEAEQARLRRHFANVQQSMSKVPTAGLNTETAKRRRAIIQLLGRYAERGVFPRNTRHPNAATPYFIDDEGRACAVGYLMMESGYEAAARDIAARQNNAFIRHIRNPALAPWLAEQGITEREAALIQPSYCSACPFDDLMGDDAVCGVDGTTYRSSCVAQQCGGVEVLSCRPCNSDDITPEGVPVNDYCERNDCTCADGGCGVAGNRVGTDTDELPTIVSLLLIAGLIGAGRRWRSSAGRQ